MKKIDLTGKFCPYPVINIITEVEKMQPGDRFGFEIDDPLALKSVPVELQDMDVEVDIEKNTKNTWLIFIKKLS